VEKREVQTPDAGSDVPTQAPRRKRGRPLEMQPEEVLARIRALASDSRGLFRIHHTEPALYARARRLFGTWQAAVRAAGFDYAGVIGDARTRSLAGRKQATRVKSQTT